MTIPLDDQCGDLDGAPFRVWSFCAACGKFYKITAVEHTHPAERARPRRVARRRSAFRRLLARQKSERAAHWEALARATGIACKEREATAKLACIAVVQQKRAARSARKAERLAAQRIKTPRPRMTMADRVAKYAEKHRRSGKKAEPKSEKHRIINAG